MNSCFKSVISYIFPHGIQTEFIPVRYRYHADKIARGPIAKKFGYEDKIFRTGSLPRLKNAERLPGPVYTPSNAWSQEKVLRGQNDYIDILGDGKLKPYDVSYEIPKWLRGKKGNEMQLLLLKEEKAKKLVLDAKLDVGDMKACVSALSLIFQSSARYSVEEDVLNNELQQLGLPKEHATALCKVYSENLNSLTQDLEKRSMRSE